MFRRYASRGVVVLFLGLIAWSPAGVLAQSNGEAESAEFKSAVPASPAFAFLNASPASVNRPVTARDLGVGLLSGVDAEGKIKQGFALEASPWGYIPGMTIPLTDYAKGGLAYIMANAQLSLATARAAGDSSKTEISVGLRFPLYDRGDPMRDPAFARSLGAALLTCAPDTPSPSPAQVAEQQACTDKATKDRFTKYAVEHWNAARLSFSIATGWQFSDSLQVADVDPSGLPALTDHRGVRTWFNGSLPLLGSSGQLVGQIAYLDQPEFEVDTDLRRFDYGGRLILGSATTNVFAELVGRAEWRTGKERHTSASWSAGVELRLSKDFWISTGVGRTWNQLDKPDRTFLIANINWAMTSQGRIESLRAGASALAAQGG